MKFALFENSRIEAKKGIKAICPSCGSVLIAKCGDLKVHHWSHKKSSNCDPWWENETEWHRLWKNNFPNDWQEIILSDEQSGEKHIADVRTDYGLVVEFQHSYINSQERISREHFYKNMVWIVDGTRLKRDYLRFLKGKDSFRQTVKKGYYIVEFPDEYFPSSWLESRVPVIFDFLGTETINDTKDLRNLLYCLLPNKNKLDSTLVILYREAFIKNVLKGELFNKQQVSETPVKKRNIVERRESTHYYDPKKGRFVKKWRF